MRVSVITKCVVTCIALLVPARASAQAMQGMLLFEKHCAACHHAPAQGSRAPDRNGLRQLSTEAIVAAMTTGAMATAAAALSDTEKRVLAEQLTGRPLGASKAGQASSMPNRCSSKPFEDPSRLAMWNGWGRDVTNTRFQPAKDAGLNAEQVSRLTLKWAFGFPGGASAFGQPTLAGGRVYVGSDIGFVYGLDQASGCVYWSYEADASVRTAITIGDIETTNGRRHALFFGDLKGNVYAIDAENASLLWRQRADPHPFARITGAPTLAGGRLYVPLSSFEEVSANNPKYECCTFRGGVVAYDARMGDELWRTYTIADPPKPLKKNAEGTQLWGPSGAAVWSSPSVDRKRDALYIATGNGYSHPAPDSSDAVIALDLKTGKRLWMNQLTLADAWIVGCPQGKPGHANCPDDPGPDFDFGSSPMLRTLPDGRDILVIGQKSGIVWALDPDKQGAVLWEQRVGRGSPTGGTVWGSAADDRQAYVPVSDALLGPTVAGSLSAVKLTDGEIVWKVRPPEMQCGDRPCTQAQSAAISVIPGVVFSGSTTGIMRAYSATDGKVIWEYNAVKEYTTANGVPAKGGTFNGPGPTIAGGMVFFNSGYAYIAGGTPGNVLLAFAPE